MISFSSSIPGIKGPELRHIGCALDFTWFPCKVLLERNKENACKPLVCSHECLPRVICLPTVTKTWWGKWGVTHGPTHALVILRASRSPAETQPLVPDVDCQYPIVVSAIRGWVWPGALSSYSAYMPSCLFSPLLRTFQFFAFVRYNGSGLCRRLSFVCCAPDCLYGTMGEHFLWL